MKDGFLVLSHKWIAGVMAFMVLFNACGGYVADPAGKHESSKNSKVSGIVAPKQIINRTVQPAARPWYIGVKRTRNEKFQFVGCDATINEQIYLNNCRPIFRYTNSEEPVELTLNDLANIEQNLKALEFKGTMTNIAYGVLGVIVAAAAAMGAKHVALKMGDSFQLVSGILVAAGSYALLAKLKVDDPLKTIATVAITSWYGGAEFAGWLKSFKKIDNNLGPWEGWNIIPSLINGFGDFITIGQKPVPGVGLVQANPPTIKYVPAFLAALSAVGLVVYFMWPSGPNHQWPGDHDKNLGTLAEEISSPSDDTYFIHEPIDTKAVLKTLTDEVNKVLPKDDTKGPVRLTGAASRQQILYQETPLIVR